MMIVKNKPFMLSVVMLNVVMLSVVIMNVVAPIFLLQGADVLNTLWS